MKCDDGKSPNIYHIFSGKPPVIPVSSDPVFKFENSLISASPVPTPVIPVSVVPVFHLLFHIKLTKKSSRQGPPAGITDKSPGRHN
jgi:hypothetical protein